MPARKTSIMLPELADTRKPGPWKKQEVRIQDSSVNLEDRIARVPKPHTTAQRLARFHELAHIKYSPRFWSQTMANIISLDPEGFEEGKYDPSIVSTLAKMVEENRIDWLLWSRHKIDLRPSREVLDWSGHPVPDRPVLALDYVLQLAWTVWASRGLGKVPDAPPPRVPDPDTSEFFDKCWQVLLEHTLPSGEHVGNQLVRAVIRGCQAIYEEPTDAQRDRVTLELLEFFPPPPQEKPEQPEEKEEEKKEQEEAEAEEKEEEEAREESATGVGSDPVTLGHYQIHDHTAGPRRPRSKITRRDIPEAVGTRLVYPHRYMLDRTVFGRKIATHASIMVDASGSMQWSNEALATLMQKLPSAWVGLYSGYSQNYPPRNRQEIIYGRICVLAKRGRFCEWKGLDQDEHGRMNGQNEVDIEALELLASWPKPRFWLSDGNATGGIHSGPWPTSDYDPDKHTRLLHDGAILYACDRLMRKAGILRVPDLDTMIALIRRQRVTLYRSSFSLDNRDPSFAKYGYSPDNAFIQSYIQESGGDFRGLEPVSFQL